MVSLLIYTIQCLHCSQVFSSEPGSMAVPSHGLRSRQGQDCPGSGRYGFLLDKRSQFGKGERQANQKVH